MKTLNEYIEESILDMDEQSADDAVELDRIYRELTEEFGPVAFHEDRSPIQRSEISIERGKLKLPNSICLNLNVLPYIFNKYKLAPIDKLNIEYYRGKVSKLPITKVKYLNMTSCVLEFDSKLKCEHLKMERCGVNDLKVSSKQQFQTVEMDYSTKNSIVDLYLLKLAPNVSEIF